MKWLIICNNQSVSEQISSILTSSDKKNKSIICSLDAESLKKQKSGFNKIAACILYIENQNKLTAEENILISSLCGYFAFDKIKLITNVESVINNSIFAKDTAMAVKDADDLEKLLSKKYKTLIQDSVKRLAKNKLLDRGIPFTSDCFATYIAKNKIEVVNEFLEAGMSVNSRDDMGVPMLNIACRNDNFEFVEMIFDLGAELNAVSDDRGYTAVMDAVWRGNEKITKYLIEKGADLNTINKEGQTNLILAVGANRENIVKLLAENGADPDVKDMMGMSAYTYATLFKKQKIVEILTPFHKA